MPRPQFTLRALLVLVFGTACFFGGMVLQRQLDKPVPVGRRIKIDGRSKGNLKSAGPRR